MEKITSKRFLEKKLFFSQIWPSHFHNYSKTSTSTLTKSLKRGVYFFSVYMSNEHTFQLPSKFEAWS